MPVWKTEVVGRYLSVTVRNAAALPITAWEVRTKIPYQDGSIEKSGISTDAALTGHREASTSFIPGSIVTKQIPSPLRDLPVTSVASIPTTVVFADGTAIGDESTMARIFESRRRELHAL